MQVKGVSEKPQHVKAPNTSPKARPSKSQSPDRLLIHGQSDDGRTLKVVRQRNRRLEFGIAQPLRHGEAVHGEIVRLTPHKDFPLLCDVETVLDTTPKGQAESRPSGDSQKGPARISSPTYRRNWAAVWGNPKRPSEAN